MRPLCNPLFHCCTSPSALHLESPAGTPDAQTDRSRIFHQVAPACHFRPIQERHQQYIHSYIVYHRCTDRTPPRSLQHTASLDKPYATGLGSELASLSASAWEFVSGQTEQLRQYPPQRCKAKTPKPPPTSPYTLQPLNQTIDPPLDLPPYNPAIKEQNRLPRQYPQPQYAHKRNSRRWLTSCSTTLGLRHIAPDVLFHSTHRPRREPNQATRRVDNPTPQ